VSLHFYCVRPLFSGLC